MVCVFQKTNTLVLESGSLGLVAGLLCQLGQVMSPLGQGDAYLDNEGVEEMISSDPFQLGHAIIP